jgi:hypothetical protein
MNESMWQESSCLWSNSVATNHHMDVEKRLSFAIQNLKMNLVRTSHDVPWLLSETKGQISNGIAPFCEILGNISSTHFALGFKAGPKWLL